MFCRKCGNELSENDLFCSKCGEKNYLNLRVVLTAIKKLKI